MPILVIALNCERAWQEILAPRLQYPESGRVPAQRSCAHKLLPIWSFLRVVAKDCYALPNHLSLADPFGIATVPVSHEAASKQVGPVWRGR